MTGSRLPIALLAVGGFTVLTTEFVIIGLLPPIARDLQVDVSQVGLLVTLFALTVAFAGPVLTALLAPFERRAVFAGTLLLFAMSNLIAALAPNFAVLAVARAVPALLLPVYWALASDTGVRIVGPERAGKAISTIALGIVTATIFGIPLGTLISDHYGWRAAFGVLAALALLKAILLCVGLPPLPSDGERRSAGAQLQILRDRSVLGHVGLSLLTFAGMFTAYTYLADLLQKLAGLSGALVSWILMGFGVAGLLGNALAGRGADRDPLITSAVFTLLLALCLMLFVPALGSVAGLTIVLAIWGTCHAALFTVSHARVMKATPQSPALGASLNVSGANLGIALGALIGGRAIDLAGLNHVGSVAATIVLSAFAATLGLMAIRSARRGNPALYDDAVPPI